MQNLFAGFLEAFNGPTVKNRKLQIYLLYRNKNLYDFSQLSYMLQVKIKFRLKFFQVDSQIPLFPRPDYSWIRARRQKNWELT